MRESLALPLELGQEIIVEIPALERRLTSRIEELVPAADPGSRSFLVKAQVEYQEDLLPGMYARLLIPAGLDRRLLIPAEYTARFGQLDVVWVWQDGTATRRFVRLGDTDPRGRTEVLSGLEAGDQLVLPPTS